MSSTRTQLYQLLKAAVMGGTFTDFNNIEYTYTGLSEVKYMGFYNTDLQQTENSVIPLPAILFELQSNPRSTIQLRTGEINSVANSKDNVTFILHVFYGKLDQDREKPYLDQLDLAEKVYCAVQGLQCNGITYIKKTDELPDVNSYVVMDYQLVFETVLTNLGQADTKDANILFNISATVNINE